MNDNNTETTTELEEKIELLLNKIKVLEEEVKNNWELFLRAKADVENIKKRTDKEIINVTKYSNKKVFIDLLPLLDSFETCLDKKDNISFDSFFLFYKMLLNIFEKYDVKKIDIKEYSHLDPSKHEVVSVVNNDVYDNVISSVLQPGYELHDHILRYAKVSILKKNINGK